MDTTKVKFGDKMFIYGQYLEYLEDFSDYEYNTIMGYITVGGYFVDLEESDEPLAAVPGFVVEFLSTPSLAFATPFVDVELIDVTNDLSRSTPMMNGTKIWAPTKGQPEFY